MRDGVKRVRSIPNAQMRRRPSLEPRRRPCGIAGGQANDKAKQAALSITCTHRQADLKDLRGSGWLSGGTIEKISADGHVLVACGGVRWRAEWRCRKWPRWPKVDTQNESPRVSRPDVGRRTVRQPRQLQLGMHAVLIASLWDVRGRLLKAARQTKLVTVALGPLLWDE